MPKSITILMPEDAQYKLKDLALKQRKSISELVREGLILVASQYGLELTEQELAPGEWGGDRLPQRPARPGD